MNPPESKCPASDSLVRGLSAIFASMGGTVRIDESGENLCRRDTQHGFVIESQGLPNLIHELVHALFLGRLEDDHGFDYDQIPLDLTIHDHRRHLWEELVCCVLSCGYAAPFESEGFALAWFTEQFEIQGVFHGLEGDLAGFRARVDRAIERPDWRMELETALDWADREVRRRLGEVGFGDLAPAMEFEALWREYRGTWAV